MTVPARDSRLCPQRRFSSGEEDYMTATHRLTSVLAAACLIVTGAVTIHGDDLGPGVNQQLAAARAATAKYHDPNQALADGYINLGSNPTEDNLVEFLNPAIANSCELDVLHPAALRYTASGQGLRLIGVEYAIPMVCSPEPPEDFLPGAGEWEQEAGVPVWMLDLNIWSGKSLHSNESH
jgi:hypothetical protein